MVKMISTEIESFHIIYRNLIKIGKPLDPDFFVSKLTKKGFLKEERILKTPTGPFREYVLHEPKGLQDMIVVSSKGFVIDSRNYSLSIDLIGLAYDLYEEFLGDFIETVVSEILVTIASIFIANQKPRKYIEQFLNTNLLKNLKDSIDTGIKPVSIGFSWGDLKKSGESKSVQILQMPIESAKGARFQLGWQYRSRDFEKGVLFVRNFKEISSKLINVLFY